MGLTPARRSAPGVRVARDFLRRVLAGAGWGSEDFGKSMRLQPRFKRHRLLGLILAGAAAWAAPAPVEPAAAPLLVKVAELRLREPRFAAAAVADGNFLYVSGGSHADQWVLDSVERIDLRTGMAEPFGRLQRGRLWHRMVVVAGTLYVVGGDAVVVDARGEKRLHTEMSVECINLATRAHASGPSLPEPRRSFACFVRDGRLHVIGGCAYAEGGASWSPTTWILDLASSRWSKGAPLPTPREAEGAWDLESGFLVAGGFNGVEALATLERYDGRAGTWQGLPPLCRPASAHAAAVLGPHLFLLGHYDDVAQCLTYDLRTRKSVVMTAPSTGARHAAVVVHRQRLYLVGGRTAESSDGFSTVQVLALGATP